jgi:hypothetical protein
VSAKQEIALGDGRGRSHKAQRKTVNGRRWLRGLGWSLAAIALITGSTVWLAGKASNIQVELTSATELIPQLRSEIAGNDSDSAATTVSRIRQHTSAAKDASDDPLWSLASGLPWIGANLRAASEITRSADDVAGLGLVPLVNVYDSLDWNALLPTAAGTDLQPLASASPSVSSSAHAVRLSSERLESIDTSSLLPQVAEPLTRAREQLREVSRTLDVAADTAEILPKMMGSEAPRNYLLMVQNNAEARATGGIPGAIAVLGVESGQLSLGAQSSATDVGIMAPVVPVESEQQQIYSGRLGKFFQDVNLTPDFPTAASTAQAMWERHSGHKVDGVLSIDPVALSYILEATGPVTLSKPELVALAKVGLPSQLDANNIVQTLLSDVYARIQDPELQDAYFAAVAQETFAALADGKGDTKGLIEGLIRGTEEGRVLVWSNSTDEQAVLANYPISGSVSGPSVSPSQFGVYYNDGTGAKMDYYVTRTVQLIKECPKDGYEQTRVRITSTNKAPADAATSLPDYVTGGGIYGVPPGAVQTNVVVYGPVQSNVENVSLNGEKTSFAPYLHSNRPVGVLAVRLAPGESKTVDFTFGKIVQHTEPNVVVTPSIQPVKDVTLATEVVACE